MSKPIPDSPSALSITNTSKPIERQPPLFRLTPGIPPELAHEHVSILLGYITHLIHQGDADDDHKLLGAAGYLSELANTLMNDIEVRAG
ncbi:DUF3077 domain-containing protein [Pseudomonas cremoricolorata]|uniref:DUF3077 domain-containing protein n=1 Tax=Pseudomonas cremoricolorata TaxID=157783 RepID=UPI0009DC1FBE|nr:DUF3077 domain-containing protein [Pseudomonas cremoricolorata]